MVVHHMVRGVDNFCILAGQLQMLQGQSTLLLLVGVGGMPHQ